MPFASLGLSPPLVLATSELGYLVPTRVQVEMIPLVLAGRDVRALAPTGSGKTAAFVLPLLERLASGAPRARREVSVLVVSPTRELAAQIAEDCVRCGRHLAMPLVVRPVFGGVSINPQMMALRGGADIVVGTPGRLLDLAEKNALSLSGVSTLILDEADRLLEEGFRDELTRILDLLPAARQTLLVSATFPESVSELAAAVLRDPAQVVVEPEGEAGAIVHRAIEVDKPRRTQLLRHLLEADPSAQALVFVATRYATEHVARKLRGVGITASALSGERSQGARTAALAAFHRGEVRALIATDLAARGLDVVGLPMVVNYDLPRSPTDYLHRAGRTGRAGATGVALSFVTAEARAHFRVIERRHGLWVPREHVPGFEPEEAEVAPERTGGVKGRRKSKKDKLREAAARKASEG